MRKRGGKISKLNKVMFFSIVFAIFIMISSVSAIDSNVTADDANLLNNDNNKIVLSSQDLDVSSYDSISENTSHDDKCSSSEDMGLLTSQYVSDDIFQANDIKETLLVGNDTELYFKNGTAFKVVLTDSDGNLLPSQNVIFNINNNNYTRVTNNDGIASIAINLNSGNYNITAFFAGTSSYGSSSTSNIIKVLSTISGEDIEKYYRENTTQYYATFVNGQGVPLNNTAVSFNVNGVYYERKTNENGTAKLNINLIPGEYVITAKNPVNSEMHSNNITVLTTIYGEDVVKYYKNDTQYYATFLNNAGGPLVNTNVTFNINGVFYTRTTDSKGIAKMNINLNPDNYTITATNPINGELHSNNIEVLPTISANDLTITYRNGRFAANVLDDVGNPSVGDTVTFNINGVFYNRTSDNEGNAYLNINLDVGQYIITATNSKGLSVSNTITVKKANSTISGKNAHVIVSVGRNYTVTLMGENNKTIDSAVVHFKYDNHVIDAVTEGGKATINLNNISIGKYPIDYWYDGDMNYYPSASSSTLIVANSTVILSAEDLNMVYKDGSRFNVTLTNLEGKALANRTITFVVNGMSYNRTTNDKGIASIAVNLIPDTYTITYSHSHVNATDYNSGSNTIVVNKLAAELVTEDLAFEYGEDADFIVTLVDGNNTPIDDMDVCFTIRGVDYYRTTNASGIAKIHIGLLTGYYEITTSLDHFLYEANSKTNHILVNGTILEGQDIDMIVGTTVDFPVSLCDAYHNPISGATVNFSYNGVSTSAVTDNNGLAVIQVSNLPKGDYPIVYSYNTTKCMAYIHVIGTISINDLVASANTVNKYIEANAALPATVVVGDETYTTAQYLYLISEAIVGISVGDYSDLYILGSINNPSNPGAAANMGNLADFIGLANTVWNDMSAGNTPNSVDTSIGTIGYDGIVYALTRVVVYYGMTNQLPGSVSVKSLKLYESKSVLDSKNTITDLDPYLLSTANCQVTNQAIVDLANKLTYGLTNSYDKAVAIYNYVRDEISYSFYYDTHYGAAGTLSAGTGNCVDQAHLSVALYRAAGLPARYVHGTCVFSSGSTYGHVWAQVLLGDTWVVSDSTSNRNSFGQVVNWNNYGYSLHGYYRELGF